MSTKSPAASFPERDNAVNLKVSVPVDADGGAGVAAADGAGLHLTIGRLHTAAAKVGAGALGSTRRLAL